MIAARGDAPSLERGKADPQVDFGWTGGTLAFRAAPASEVAAMVGRWLDIPIDVDSTLRSEKVTLSINEESSNQALTVLSTILQARIVWSGQTARLIPQ
jgi:ferric-dicitrate binding protein FerR (iron transport regulator)